MKLNIYQIDAFAENCFEGNPAAVIPLVHWLADDLMQSIAQENNLAETAFFVPGADGAYHIRWFTPQKEVKLCGHATLACAFVLFSELDYEADTVYFDSLSGRLAVSQSGAFLTLDFPNQMPVACDVPENLIKGLGKRPSACYKNEDYIAVFEDEREVAGIVPNHFCLQQLELRGVIVTAPSPQYDFIARFFAPRYGIPEDPVTGSAYTQIAPYWAKRLEKTVLNAKQISPRGGKLRCEVNGKRVLISGTAVKYMEGVIEIDQ